MIFQDFPGPGIFMKKNPGLSRRRGNPVLIPPYSRPTSLIRWGQMDSEGT